MSMSNIAKNSGIVLMLSFSATLIGYFLRLFLARNLTVADYGLFYAILSSVGFLATFRDLGLNPTLSKFIPEFLVKGEEGKVKAAVAFVALVQITLGFIIVVPILMFADEIALLYFHTSAATLPLRLISMSFLVSIIMSLLQTVFQGLEKMFYFAAVEPLRLSIAFVVSFLLINLGVAGPSYGYLFASIAVSAVLGLLFLNALRGLKVRMELDAGLAKKMMLFGLPLFVGGLGTILISYADTIILTLYRSLYEVGLYHAAMPTSQLLWFFIGGISAVLLPTVSGLWSSGKKDEISDGVLILTKILFMMITPLSVIFVVFPEIILRVLFGESFVAASSTLQILAAASIFYSLYFMFNTILIAIGKPGLFTKIWFTVGMVGVFLNIALTPMLGISGAAIAVSVSYAFGLVMAIFYSKRFYTIRFPVSDMAKALLGGFLVMLLIALLKYSVEADAIVKMLLAGVISVSVYTVFSIRFIVNRGDLRILSAIGIRLPRPINVILEKVLR